MDPWNPIMDETYVKRVPFWQALAWELLGMFALVAFGWILLCIVLQLDLLAPFWSY